jgi:hypothetical protein
MSIAIQDALLKAPTNNIHVLRYTTESRSRFTCVKESLTAHETRMKVALVARPLPTLRYVKLCYWRHGVATAAVVSLPSCSDAAAKYHGRNFETENEIPFMKSALT